VFWVSLLSPPYLVYRDRQDDDETIHDVLPERIDAKEIETVADGRDQERSDQSPDDVAFSAKKARSSAPDEAIVTFYGNGYTSAMQVIQMTARRCAEATLQHGYRYFVGTAASDASSNYSFTTDVMDGGIAVVIL
jgi:hypothetical protein